MPLPVELPFQSLIDAIRDTETPVNARFIYRLSDLDKSELDQLAPVWDLLPTWRRRALMEDAEVMGKKDTLLSFEALALFAVRDRDASVRLPAVRALWEFESHGLIDPLLELFQTDEDQEVRAAAAAGLGNFVYLGEVEHIPVEKLHQIEEALLKAARGDEPDLLKRRVLEALGFSSRKEVPALIQAAYQSTEKTWVASALLAMGRSAHGRWKEMVVSSLENPYPIVRAEAARAAGELEIKSTRKQLIDLLDDPDVEVRMASVWSLSQIGGAGVRTALERMFKKLDDGSEADFIEEALDNLAFTEDIPLQPLLEITEDGEVEEDDLEDDEYELDDEEFEEFDLIEDEDDQV